MLLLWFYIFVTKGKMQSNIEYIIIFLSCLKTGGLFECGGGWAAELRRERAVGGLFMGPNAPASIENVAGAFGKITSFDTVTYPQTNTDSTMEMIEQCSRVDAGEGPDLD